MGAGDCSPGQLPAGIQPGTTQVTIKSPSGTVLGSTYLGNPVNAGSSLGLPLCNLPFRVTDVTSASMYGIDIAGVSGTSWAHKATGIVITVTLAVRRLSLALAALSVIGAVAACGGYSTPSPAKSTSGQVSAISKKSFEDGLLAGEALYQPNTPITQIDANCAAAVSQAMPANDIKARWEQGCAFGTIQGGINADKASEGSQ
jgi:hypothetical protein